MTRKEERADLSANGHVRCCKKLEDMARNGTEEIHCAYMSHLKAAYANKDSLQSGSINVYLKTLHK